MTKPRLVKVRALFYVLQQFMKRGRILILIHPLHIVLDFGIYKCNVSINIQKICQVPINGWLNDEENSIVLYLLEEVTGKILGIRLSEFPLMTELKYLLRLQQELSKEEVDIRIFEGESINTIQEMLMYSIFYGEISESGIIFDESGEVEEDK